MHDSTDKKWYAIYVKSRYEKRVYQELCDKGIKSSLPLMIQTRQWSDRIKKIEVPLFRGYIFVKIDISIEKLNVLQTDGVVKFVTFCNKTVSIPNKQMYWLDQILMSELQLKSTQDFPLGTEVEVIYGPLKGLSGRIKQHNSKTKLVVWFDSFAQGISVEIDPAYLFVRKGNKIELLEMIRQKKEIDPVLQSGEYIT